MNFEQALKAPFSLSDLEWRVGSTFKDGSKGLLLAFVDARAIEDRLDKIFGVHGWKNEYFIHDKGVICKITATAEDGTVIEKSDGAEYTDINSFKGALSGALKRTAAVMGIGRYLYDMPSVNVDLDNRKFKGKVEAIPDQFLPEDERTGSDEVKVTYFGKKTTKKTTPASEEDVAWAMNFVVRNDKYNQGKKMSEVWEKSLRFLANGKDEEQAKAARIVASHKGFNI